MILNFGVLLLTNFLHDEEGQSSQNDQHDHSSDDFLALLLLLHLHLLCRGECRVYWLRLAKDVEDTRCIFHDASEGLAPQKIKGLPSKGLIRSGCGHILRKLSVSDRTQSAVWAVRKGLV